MSRAGSRLGPNAGLCEWPGGCERRKVPGKGSRFCLPHRLVGSVKETRRKRAAARESRLEKGPTRAHDGAGGGLLDTAQERERWRLYRDVLKEFGLR